MMAGLTREQRAEKAAKLATENIITAPTLDEIPEVKRSEPTLLDAKEHAEKILAARKAFNGLESKLAFEGDHPGWKRRWVNEENVPGRIDEHYRFVLRDEVSMSDSLRFGNEDTGDRVSKHAGTRGGVPFKAFLMEIPEEIAKLLDKEKSHDQIARYEHSIRNGAAGDPVGNSRVGRAAGLSDIELKSF